MPKPREYGTPVGVEKPSSSEGRQTAQPPSEAYVRAQMNRQRRTAADEPAKATKRPKPEETTGPSPSDADNPTRDLSAATAARRIMGRKSQIDKAIDDE